MQDLARDLLKEGERIDDLQRNGYQIIQDPKRFCFGMDAVLLSDFAKAHPTDRVVDLGTGTGIVPILMAAKTQAKSLTGIEIQTDSAEMAERSVRLNHLEDRIRIISGDLREASTILGKDSCEVVTSNPPYMIAQHGLVNPADAKAIARHELCCTLEDVVRETAELLVPGGHCYYVHRPFRLVDIFCLMRQYHVEPKRMRMVYPYADREPNMVLIEGVRGGQSRLTVEEPLIVYDEPGQYTQEIYDIYGYATE